MCTAGSGSAEDGAAVDDSDRCNLSVLAVLLTDPARGDRLNQWKIKVPKSKHANAQHQCELLEASSAAYAFGSHAASDTCAADCLLDGVCIRFDGGSFFAALAGSR